MQASCEVVLATYGDLPDVATAISTVGCPRVYVYSKLQHDCRNVRGSADVQEALRSSNATLVCEEMSNVGREQHTFAHHATEHYDELSETVYFVPLPLERHDRLALLQALTVSEPGISFLCDY